MKVQRKMLREEGLWADCFANGEWRLFLKLSTGEPVFPPMKGTRSQSIRQAGVEAWWWDSVEQGAAKWHFCQGDCLLWAALCAQCRKLWASLMEKRREGSRVLCIPFFRRLFIALCLSMTWMFLLPARCAGLSQNVPTHEVGLEFHLLRNSSS